jgi:hypothetical protein
MLPRPAPAAALQMTRLPNFFILGAGKSGTTALYHWLDKHPQVHLSTPKEPYFFEDEYAQGPEFYWRTYFAAGWRGQQLIGEARAAHLFLPFVPQRIYETVPDARLVAILRNPVERAYSHWWMQRSHGHEPLDFDAALRENQHWIDTGRSLEGPAAEHLWRTYRARTPNRLGLRPVHLRPYLEAGHYAWNLERYLRHFPRSRICVLYYDDLCRSPLETMRQLCEFLGLDPAAVHDVPGRENVALTGFSRPFFALSERLQLDRFLPRRFLAMGRTLLSKIGTRPVISAAAREWLHGHYEPHNRRLEELLDRDLSAWNR